MSDLFGGIGQVAGAAIQASAQKDVAQMQIDALQKQRDFVFQQLDPSTVNAQATQASDAQAVNRLALQGQVDPALLGQRYTAESSMANQTAQLGNGPAQAVGDVAAAQAIAGTQQTTDAKTALIDAALQNLKLGATLPPDVQAELVQTGLERTGQMTQTSDAQGFGGTILRNVLGTAGIQLQQQRQTQAANLAGQAQNLEASRAQILGNLFPNLSSVQLNTLQGTENAFNTSNNALPQAGLGAQDIANLWLQRVGASSNLATQQAQVAAQGALGQAQAWAPAIGGAAASIGTALPAYSTSNLMNSLGSNPSALNGAVF